MQTPWYEKLLSVVTLLRYAVRYGFFCFYRLKPPSSVQVHIVRTLDKLHTHTFTFTLTMIFTAPLGTLLQKVSLASWGLSAARERYLNTIILWCGYGFTTIGSQPSHSSHVKPQSYMRDEAWSSMLVVMLLPPAIGLLELSPGRRFSLRRIASRFVMTTEPRYASAPSTTHTERARNDRRPYQSCCASARPPTQVPGRAAAAARSAAPVEMAATAGAGALGALVLETAAGVTAPTTVRADSRPSPRRRNETAGSTR